MDCKKAEILFAPHIMGDPQPGRGEYGRLEAHLSSCQDCRGKYALRRQTMAFIENHKEVFADTLLNSQEKDLIEQDQIKRSWKGIEAALHKEKRIKFSKLLIRISAAAACLIITMSALSVLLNYSRSQSFIAKSSSGQVAAVFESSVKIELAGHSGNMTVKPGQIITSNNEFKTLIINNKHQMVMNTNTVLAIEPLAKNNNIGCIVKLDSGEIYTHVERDGNPFIVETANGQAVITGTTFDVKATENSTILVVSEGTVQFKSENGLVKVVAGQVSEIVGQSVPSIPLSCNTAELTAWATGYKHGPALAQAESDTDPWYLTLLLGREPIILEETDYGHWVGQKRDWFKQEFPWIFQLKEALAKENIEVDYPELLIKTGDVWQFVYLDVRPVQFSVIDPNSLLRIASDYGFDKLWLLENIPVAKSALEKPALSENSFTGLKAFKRWLKYLDETEGLDSPTPISSYHASKYLAETRSLIWFAVRGSKYDLTDEERTEILAVLQEEVIAAYECQSDVLYPSEDQKSYSCENKCRDPVDNIIGHIEAMKAVEEKIVEYRISE